MIAILRASRTLVAVLTTAVLASACSSSTPATPTPTGTICAYAITQPTTSFGPEGGTGTVAITASSGCTWTAASSGSFLTITSGASGSGNGSIAFAVAVNTGTDRVATLTVAGTAISITQKAAVSGPPPTLAAPALNAPIGGVAVTPGRPTLIVNNAIATGSIGTVTYHFEVSDQPSFPADPVRTFTVDGVAQGSGTTSWVVTHDLGANVLWYWRARATNGTVTSAFSSVETFSTGSPCSFSLSPASASVNGGGGSVSVAVTTTASCAWTAASTDAFLSVSGSGTGSGTFTITAAANSGAARTGTVTVTGTVGGSASFALTQDVNCTYNATPNALTVTNTAAAGQTFVVTTSFASCGWRAAASSDAPWLAVTAGDTNTGQGTVTFSVQANSTGALRVGVINITGLIGGSGVFTVTQQP